MSFKICSVGCGHHASWAHGPSLMKYSRMHEGVELAACCDIDAGKAEIYKENFGFSRAYSDMSIMLEVEKPDAVSLVLPPHLTVQVAAQILERNIPLILEKPPASSKDELIRLIEIADKGNIPNLVAFNRRYHPLVKKLTGLMGENLIPRQVSSIHYDMFRVGRTESDFWTTAIHGIDLVRYLARSDYANIKFSYKDLPEAGPGAMDIFLECSFECGTSAYLSFCPVSGVSMERVGIHAKDNSYFLSIPMWVGVDWPGRLTHIHKNKLEKDFQGRDLSTEDGFYECCGFYDENELFFDTIRSGGKPEGDLKTCLQTVEIAECLKKRIQEYNAL
jgi:myo-inositol 2-dehydrogenase / D-chiro-inositol 1-dehydrogenase